MEDADFLAAFEAATLPEDRFHHADHVRAAWLLLREETPAAALDRFSSALKRFAAANGKTRLYHETITWAYVLLTNERRERGENERRRKPDECAPCDPPVRLHQRLSVADLRLPRSLLLLFRPLAQR